MNSLVYSGVATEGVVNRPIYHSSGNFSQQLCSLVIDHLKPVTCCEIGVVPSEVFSEILTDPSHAAAYSTAVCTTAVRASAASDLTTYSSIRLERCLAMLPLRRPVVTASENTCGTTLRSKNLQRYLGDHPASERPPLRTVARNA